MGSTNTQFPRWPISDLNAEFNGPASLAVGIGDLLYWDGTVIRPFSGSADKGSLALQQAYLARRFAGVSNSAQLASDATQRPLRVIIDDIFEFACPSQTFAFGDYVGAYYTASAAVDQQVTKVSYPHLAIGRVVKAYASATTVVKCRLMGRAFALGRQDPFMGIGSFQGHGTATALADSAVTLAVDSNPILTQTPTANRVVTLPDESASAGLMFYLKNLAGATFTSTLKDAATNTVAVAAATKAAIAWCDGTTWYGLGGA